MNLTKTSKRKLLLIIGILLMVIICSGYFTSKKNNTAYMTRYVNANNETNIEQKIQSGQTRFVTVSVALQKFLTHSSKLF